MQMETTNMFILNDEERQLRDSVDQVLRNEHLESGNLWAQFNELGWTGACVPAAVGGYSETGREALIISERLGAHGIVAPLMASVYAPVRLLCADKDVSQEWGQLLTRIAKGEALVTIAWAEQGRPFDRLPRELVAEERENGSWRLFGRKTGVFGAVATSSHFIVSAKAFGEVALFLVSRDNKGMRVLNYQTLGGFECADIVLDSVSLDASACIASSNKAEELLSVGLDSGADAACSDMVGAIEAVLKITMDYTSIRKQFGISIASFQVVQHRLVDLAINLEYARSCKMILMDSDHICFGSKNPPELLLGVRSEIMQRAQRAVSDAVQLHGGIGMTMESPVSHYFKRVKALANTWGNGDWHMEAYRSSRSEMADLIGR